MPCRKNSRSANVIWKSSVLISRQLYTAVGHNRSIPMEIFRAIRQNLHVMAVSQESLEKRIQKIKHQIANWEIYPLALCRSSTTSVAAPIAAAKPFPQSNMALITKSVLHGTARAPASLSVRKTSTRLNSNWKTIANSANSSTSGSPCRRSCPACAFVRSAERRMMKSNAVNREFPSDRAWGGCEFYVANCAWNPCK